MIPIYPAIQKYNSEVYGGSTKPWRVAVDAEYEDIPSIVKLYKTDYVTKECVVAKEIYASILAKQLQIPTPEFFLVDFTKAFLATLNHESKQFIEDKHKGPLFATRELQDCHQFQEEMMPNDIWQFDLESLYAFDNLIKNGDRGHRGHGKANVLIKNKAIFVIDHEQTFSVNSKTKLEVSDNQWIYWHEKHIAWRFLRNRGVEVKRTLFSNFALTLSSIDLQKFEMAFAQLEALGLDYEKRFVEMYDYLSFMKRNSEKFVQILRGTIA